MAGAVFAGFGKGLSEGHRQGIANRQQGLQERQQDHTENESLWDKAIKTVDGLANNAVNLITNSPSPDKIPRQTLQLIEQNVNTIASEIGTLPGGEKIGPALLTGFQSKVKSGLTMAQKAEQAANADILQAQMKDKAGMESGMVKPKSAREQGDEIKLGIERKIVTGGKSSLTPGELDYYNSFMVKQSSSGDPLMDALDLFSKQNGGGDTAVTAPTAPETPPSTSARKAPDGNWYEPDPSRPGKWILVK